MWFRDQTLGFSEAQIVVYWRAKEYYQPPAVFVAQANAAGRLLELVRSSLPGRGTTL